MILETLLTGVPSYQPETEDAHSYDYSILEENAIYYAAGYIKKYCKSSKIIIVNQQKFLWKHYLIC